MNTWSQQTSIKNTSYDQHLYLTKCIIVCHSFWNETDKNVLAEDLMKLLLKGVEQHLHSPIANLRTLGKINNLFWKKCSNGLFRTSMIYFRNDCWRKFNE